MNTRSFLTRFFHFPAPACAAVTVVTLVTLACSSLAVYAKSPSEALYRAVREGNAEKAASLVAQVSPAVAANALDEAAKLGNLDVVQALVARGVDINGGVGGGQVPGNDRSLDIANLVWFAGSGAQTSLTTPLIAAAGAGKIEIVKWLIDHGASLDLQVAAVKFEDPHQEHGMMVFRAVLVKQAGNNALSQAINQGRVSIAQVLVEHGADLSRQVVFRTAEIPSLCGLVPHKNGPGMIIANETTNDLYEDRGNHVRQGEDGLIYTDLRVWWQQEATIRQLASHSTLAEIRVLAGGPTGETEQSRAMSEAARGGDLAKVQALLKDNPALVFSRDNLGSTPLHAAAGHGHKDVVELLLANKADVNATDDFGVTPLHAAASGGHKDVAELLVANKANVNARSTGAESLDGVTPLHEAAYYCHRDVAQLLLASGADVNSIAFSMLTQAGSGQARVVSGVSPLYLAAISCDNQTADLLLASGAEVNAKDDDGATPLYVAAVEGRKDMAELLLSKGAEVNATARTGTTPLYAASHTGHPDVVELLIQHGGRE